MIRIVIAESDPVQLRTLSDALSKQENIELLPPASTRENTLKQLSDLPDILVLAPEILKDHTLSRFMRVVQTKSPQTRVVHFLKKVPPDENLISDMKTGIRGYIKAADSPSIMVKAIRSVHEGELWAERRILEKALSKPMILPETLQMQVPGLAPLTHREVEMLSMVLQGASNREIADRSSISERTVKTHLYRVYRKLKVKSRTKAIALLSHS